MLIFQHGQAGKLERGRYLLEYLPESRRQPFNDMTNKVLAGETVEYDQAYPLENDSVVWFQFTLSPVWEGYRVTGLCISGREVTEQIRARQAAE